MRNLTRLKMMMDAFRSRAETYEQLGLEYGIATVSREDATKASILVIEDNLDSANYIKEILQTKMDDDITVFEDGTVAIDSALEDSYELVVLSMDLMKEDSLRLVAQLRAREELRNMPVLVLIEEHEEEVLTKAFELGVNDYLVRPIESSELILRSRTQIRHRRYQERLSSDYRDTLAMAVTDSLSGLYNRRYLETHLPRMMQEAIHDMKDLTVIMVDVDHFKDVNDRYGHATGDEVLKGSGKTYPRERP